MAGDRGILVANTTAVLMVDGRRVTVQRGISTAHPDHPIVREHPELWSPFAVQFDVDKAPKRSGVEQATAAPGEKREMSARGKRTRKADDES